jgi:oligosaccharyltransferase complex subunit delta (ribophorin II)
MQRTGALCQAALFNQLPTPRAAQGFPSGAGFLAAAGFHAGLLAILALYLLFWLKLNMMQTIPALALLAAGTAAAGSSALNQLAATKQE